MYSLCLFSQHNMMFNMVMFDFLFQTSPCYTCYVEKINIKNEDIILIHSFKFSFSNSQCFLGSRFV